jgi:hypothetical protein
MTTAERRRHGEYSQCRHGLFLEPDRLRHSPSTQVSTGPGSAMTYIQTTKFVGYPWADLFNLVLDVKSYPEFVP